VPSPAQALIGGRYAVREVLAVGGMSTVHLAEDVLLGREVALKVFRTSGDPFAAERLRREGALLARLDHADLVRAFDAGADEDGSNAWLALELLAGPNVAVALHRDGPLSPRDAARLLQHIAGALDYIHGLGIVHRDIKPSNVVLTADPCSDPDWRAKLADFGIAMQLEAGRGLVGDFPVGTAAYFSPEQTLGQPVTTASDVYSLGLVVLEALTGERVFPGGAVESATARLFRQPTLPDWLDDGWRALLETMTAREPRSRPTAAQVGAACRSLATELSAAPVRAGVRYDPEMWTEPATLLAALLPAAPEPGSGAGAVPVPVPAGRTRRRLMRPRPGFADRFSRRALVLSSAGLLVLCTAAGGSALVAAAPAAPVIPLAEALPTAPPVEPVVTPKPRPEQAATPTHRTPHVVTAPVVATHPVMKVVAVDGPTKARHLETKRHTGRQAGPGHTATKHGTANNAHQGMKAHAGKQQHVKGGPAHAAKHTKTSNGHGHEHGHSHGHGAGR
jgi:eukaryotic-like serine/threonine-protein kinase